MNPNPQNRSRRNAFTLVELLVVVAIIALLLSILLPALSRARVVAASVACMSNVRQIGIALEYYKNDFNERIINSQSNIVNDPYGSWWYSQLGIRYLQLDKSVSFFESNSFRIFQCPADKAAESDELSYGYNFFIPTDSTVNDVKPMEQTIIMDNPPDNGGGTRIGYGQVPDLHTIQARHLGDSNVLYVDSHVARETIDDIVLQLYPLPIKDDDNNNIKYWRQLQ